MSDPIANDQAPDVTARDRALDAGPPPPPAPAPLNAYSGAVQAYAPAPQDPGHDTTGFYYGQTSDPTPVFLPKNYRSPRYPVILAATAVVTFIGMALNVAFSQGFPSNAPVEMFLSAALSFDLICAGVTLVILTILIALHRTARPPRVGGLDGFAIAAVSCGIVAVIGWLLLSGPSMFGSLISGERGRYDGNVSGAWVAGFPWALAFVFGALGVRRGASRLSTIFAVAGLFCGLVVLVPVLAGSFIYGLGLSD